MRGQFETPGGDDPAEYRLDALAADVATIADQLGPDPEGKGIHLLGHSLGGLVAREALLAGPVPPGVTTPGTPRHSAPRHRPLGTPASPAITSLTLMSSGPGALTGPRSVILQALLTELNGTAPSALQAEVERIWKTRLEPEAVAGGVPVEIIDFLRTRLLHSSAMGLRAMGQALLGCPDRVQALADLDGLPFMVVYGENDDAWEPAAQEDMAARLGAQRVCIPAAAHSPAVEAPATTASTLTAFWNSVECSRARPRN